MMLNGCSGPTSTGCGAAPSGASHSIHGVPAPASSSATSGSAPAPSITAGGTAALPCASANSRRAWASPSMDAMASGVTDGASGATTTPARRAPRYTAA